MFSSATVLYGKQYRCVFVVSDYIVSQNSCSVNMLTVSERFKESCLLCVRACACIFTFSSLTRLYVSKKDKRIYTLQNLTNQLSDHSSYKLLIYIYNVFNNSESRNQQHYLINSDYSDNTDLQIQTFLIQSCFFITQYLRHSII